MQEDLAALFSRNLSLAPKNQTSAVAQADPQEAQHDSPINYSISQHYHHSAHLASPTPTSRLSSHDEAATDSQYTDQVTTEIILSRNGVDPSTLASGQLSLFQQADSSQKMRLVELWRISAPGPNDSPLLPAYDTRLIPSMEQEEALAKLRLERRSFEERRKWGYSSIQGSQAENNRLEDRPALTEPYISSGYESLAQREYDRSQGDSKESFEPLGPAVGGSWVADAKPFSSALDPVYQGSDMWQDLTGQQDMACQYGTYEQANQFGASPGVVIVRDTEDEEML